MPLIHQPSPLSFIAPPVVTPRRTVDVWPIDPRWNRVEWCDDNGVPLGIVTFERRSFIMRPKRRRHAVLTSLNLVLTNLTVWLKESLGCRLSTN